MRSDPHRDTGVGWFMMCKCCNVPICSSLLHLGCITDEKSIPHSFDFWTKLCCGHGHVFVELCQLKLCYSSYSHFCWTMSTPVRHSNRSRTCPILEGPSRTPKKWNRFLVWVKVFRFFPHHFVLGKISMSSLMASYPLLGGRGNWHREKDLGQLCPSEHADHDDSGFAGVRCISSIGCTWGRDQWEQ